MIKILRKYISSYLNTIKISNVFKSEHNKTALLSYITMPFYKNSFSHTNYFEAQSWAKALDSLGYQVDVIHYDFSPKKLDTTQYDLICGFGDVFQKHFETVNSSAKTIHYGTGMHVCHQNNASLSRVRDVHTKKGVWLGGSARFVEKTWTHQTALVDGIIALGSDVCADSYRKYYAGKVFASPLLFYQVQDVDKIMKERGRNSNTHFLWFGGSGLIHKGLDLLLDYFYKNPNLTLHICGPIESEPLFIQAYKKELFQTKNIIMHGFVDIRGQVFEEIIKKCAFVVFPSCSEGGAASVLNAVANGGLIPIITKQTAVFTGYEIWIRSLDMEGVSRAIKEALTLSDDEITSLQYKNYNYVKSNNSQENYYSLLRCNIKQILNNENTI
jgi:glycosyltransferase involved in cell wall biosynthesis